MAELYVIGELVGATGFSSKSLCCRYSIVYGEGWDLHSGEATGQTQTDYAQNEMTIWSHPLDLQFSLSTILGWPKISVQVFKIDSYGNYDLEGYGHIQIPQSTGTFNMKCVTWKPIGSSKEEYAQKFLGVTPRLANDSIISNGDDRRFLRTQTSGLVYLKLGIITREMEKYGIVTEEQSED